MKKMEFDVKIGVPSNCQFVSMYFEDELSLGNGRRGPT